MHCTVPCITGISFFSREKSFKGRQEKGIQVLKNTESDLCTSNSFCHRVKSQLHCAMFQSRVLARREPRRPVGTQFLKKCKENSLSLLTKKKNGETAYWMPTFQFLAKSLNQRIDHDLCNFLLNR